MAQKVNSVAELEALKENGKSIVTYGQTRISLMDRATWTEIAYIEDPQAVAEAQGNVNQRLLRALGRSIIK